MIFQRIVLVFMITLLAGCAAPQQISLEITPPASATSLPASPVALTPVFLPSPTPIHTKVVIATSISRATATPSPQSTPTTQSVLPTPTPHKRGLNVPIGDYYKFVIYKTKGGERLADVASQYNTTVDAIISINFKTTDPLLAATLVIVPVGFSNVEDLPIFVAYQVRSEDRGVSADGLAKILRVNAFDLKYYNNMFDPVDRPMVGDWILVPWPRSVKKIWIE